MLYELEYELFTTLRDRVSAEAPRLIQAGAVLAQLDVLAALAELAARHGYCRPEIVAEPVFEVEAGRHPVLDAFLSRRRLRAQRRSARRRQGPILLITGPNMAGKSTYIRQVALIAILAHLGSFVPARRARIGIVDRLFARVGATDDLSRSQSTFMVEMSETANILNNASPQSLVILDEIGRGTSTFDGISLAWAITEHIHDAIGCRTLFATHYHELVELEKTKPRLRNANVAVREKDGEIVFLYQIVPGGADQSYGIHVARLAGVPAPVLERAAEILKFLEKQHGPDPGLPEGPIRRKVKTGRALTEQPVRGAPRSDSRRAPTSGSRQPHFRARSGSDQAAEGIGWLNHSAFLAAGCTFRPLNCCCGVIATPFDHFPAFKPKTYIRLPCQTWINFGENVAIAFWSAGKRSRPHLPAGELKA